MDTGFPYDRVRWFCLSIPAHHILKWSNVKHIHIHICWTIHKTNLFPGLCLYIVCTWLYNISCILIVYKHTLALISTSKYCQSSYVAILNCMGMGNSVLFQRIESLLSCLENIKSLMYHLEGIWGLLYFFGCKVSSVQFKEHWRSPVPLRSHQWSVTPGRQQVVQSWLGGIEVSSPIRSPVPFLQDHGFAFLFGKHPGSPLPLAQHQGSLVPFRQHQMFLVLFRGHQGSLITFEWLEAVSLLSLATRTSVHHAVKNKHEALPAWSKESSKTKKLMMKIILPHL